MRFQSQNHWTESIERATRAISERAKKVDLKTLKARTKQFLINLKSSLESLAGINQLLLG